MLVTSHFGEYRHGNGLCMWRIRALHLGGLGNGGVDALQQLPIVRLVRVGLLFIRQRGIRRHGADRAFWRGGRSEAFGAPLFWETRLPAVPMPQHRKVKFMPPVLGEDDTNKCSRFGWGVARVGSSDWLQAEFDCNFGIPCFVLRRLDHAITTHDAYVDRDECTILPQPFTTWRRRFNGISV